MIDELLLRAPDPDAVRARVHEHLAERAARFERVAVEVRAVDGNPAAELLALRVLHEVDLLVMGARGLHGLRHFVLGSTADRVMRRPGSPLLLVDRAPTNGEFKQILVGLEWPARVTPALRTALAMAHDLRAEVSVLHVLPPRGNVSDRRHVELEADQVPGKLEHLIAGLDATVPVEIVVRNGDFAVVLPQVARELSSQLLVLGAERNADGWPGRVVDRVARAGLPSLLLVWNESES